MIGSIVKVIVDRPLGSRHPEFNNIIYPINYGYIEGIMAPDGEEQDAYVLGIHTAVKEFTGRVIAVIHREDDVEEKWVVAPDGIYFSEEEIKVYVDFQERFFKYSILR
ncbi:MAG: inorganic pyrophosphatase [Clostridiales bacterium]|nr:inorganic pyrophosphatase [Clostridiales bacterium]